MSEYMTICKSKLISTHSEQKFGKQLLKIIYTGIENTFRIMINATKDTQDLYNENNTQ